MFVGKVTSRLSRSNLAQYRNSLLLYVRQKQQHHVPFLLCNQFHSFRCHSQNKVVTRQVSVIHHSLLNTSAELQRFGISSTTSPVPNERGTDGAAKESADAEGPNQTEASASGDTEAPNPNEDSGSGSKPQTNTSRFDTKRRRGPKRIAFSDSDSGSDAESDLSMEDLVKLVEEKEELLEMKDKEIEKMKDKVLRSYAEMENVMDRMRRESESSKKFAIQSFAKSLLDVADNLSRASSIVKDSFSKIDTSKDTAGAVPLLNTLLEGVEMTEKQLAEVFKKFGVEKYDSIDEQFDPHRHNAVFQVPDPSKPPDTVAVVLKSGYMLHDRIIRPAEVGVTVAVDKNAS